MRSRAVLAVGSLVALALLVAPAAAFEPDRTFHEGALLFSVEGGGGVQENLQGHPNQTELEIWYGGGRLGYLPWGAIGRGALHGAPELGLEAIYLRYVDPVEAFYAGLAAVGRYHFLSLGRFVPYLEAGAAAGGTDLEVREIDSEFAFLLFAGIGASVFVTDSTALYAGYRLLHVSNGNIDSPNRGFEAHTGVAGISFFFK
jgi:opacity protein-like surface antigen